MARVDYYLVLGVDERSDDTEIREAYRRLARRYHPDINPEDERAAMRFKLVSDAYRLLSDPVQRAAYRAPLPPEQRAKYDAHLPTPLPLSDARPALAPQRSHVRSAPPPAGWRALGWRDLLGDARGWPRLQQLAAAAWRYALTARAIVYRGKPGVQTAAGIRVASFGNRIAAALIDLVTLVIGLVLFIFIIGAIGYAFDLGIDSSSYSDTNDLLVLLLFFSPVYFVTLWTFYGRTLGCAIMDLKVRQLNGDTLTVSVAALRWLCASVSCMPLFLGFLWLLRDEEGLAWHDRLSGSVVVQEQPEQAEIRVP